MPKLFLTPFVIAGLLFLPSCSKSNCSNFDSNLQIFTDQYLKGNEEAAAFIEKSFLYNNADTWIPILKKGLDASNYALDNPVCLSSEEKAMWQTTKQDLLLKLEYWINQRK